MHPCVYAPRPRQTGPRLAKVSRGGAGAAAITGAYSGGGGGNRERVNGTASFFTGRGSHREGRGAGRAHGRAAAPPPSFGLRPGLSNSIDCLIGRAAALTAGDAQRAQPLHFSGRRAAKRHATRRPARKKTGPPRDKILSQNEKKIMDIRTFVVSEQNSYSTLPKVPEWTIMFFAAPEPLRAR